MSNSDQNVHHEAEPEQPKIDERLSKLSLIARNVTLRLSSPTNTKHGKISRKFTGKESRTDINLVEKSKGEVANLKTLSLNKIKHGDMRSTSAHSSNINQDAQAMENRNNCSQISMRSEKYTHSPPKARTCTLKSSSLTDTSNKGNVLPVNCKQSQKQKVEKGENLSESYVCAKQVGKVTHNCEEPPNSGTISASCLTGQFEIAEKVSPKRLDEVQHHNSCKRMPSRKITGQTSSVKPRIAFGPIQRRKSMKLGERSLVRKKSFLKKGDGLAAKGRYLTKRIKADDTGERKMTSTSEEKYKDNDSIRRFPRMPGRKDNTNCTFLLTRNRKLLNKAINPVLDGNKSANSFPRSRRQWNENSVQTYEAMIFSSVCAFSEELRESSEIINSKLQSLYGSRNKAKTSVFTKKSNGLTKEWRQNNRELLDSGSQEIAEIFGNLRKVESNLKTVDQAISILLKEKSRSKERR